MAKKSPQRPDLATFDKAENDDKRNRLLLAWLSDDDDRAALFALVNEERKGILEFQSRDAAPSEPCNPTNERPRPPPETGHKTVYLVTSRKRIEDALLDGGGTYSNRLYGELGGGNFMLALDPATTGAAAHAAQLKALCESFRKIPSAQIDRVSHHACHSAAILSLRSQKFDLATFAEQAGLRFCESLFGYSYTDHPLLEKSLRAGYKALVHQVLGRHFVTDPLAIPQAKQAMGQLLVRTGALIDAYAAKDEDFLKGCKVASDLGKLEPVMKSLGEYVNDLNGEQRAVIAVGAVAGTVGNVQAAVCIAVKHFFRCSAAWDEAQELIRREKSDKTGYPLEWRELIGRSLCLNPPIPFLPRLVTPAMEGRPAYSEIILALGGGTSKEAEDPLIWGLPVDGKHWCIGRDLAWSLIIEAVRHVLGLPELAEQLDPENGEPKGLKKRWGFVCESYPLSYRRDRRAAQSSLNVAMRIKAPVKENADRLRAVIRAGAPQIEEALCLARHVHFAWFEFIERDTVLVLHTVYDGDFSAYIQHFALQVGDLFDSLFESIEIAPPAPVTKFPDEFVALIQRFNRAPAMGYFFSAYPRSEAAQIARDERHRT